MHRSKHTIIGRIPDSDDYYILNLLSKQADIMDRAHAEAFLAGDYIDENQLVAKGYLADEKEELMRYNEAYLNFLDARDTDEIQLFYVPSYMCNFACSYCYQAGYEQHTAPSGEVLDAFFDYIDTNFAGKNIYITVFGGEPLLPDKATRDHISSIIEKSKKRSIPLAFVTNGYTLSGYVPLLRETYVKEVQVTLDGPPEVHDARRMLKGGQGTFKQIASGIDTALLNGIPINLRVVVDKENAPYLPELARYAKKKGWSSNPLFKTQLGRNYELHTCQSDSSRLYDRLSMYQDLYHMIKEEPSFLEFHKPAYSIAKFLFEQGELPEPLFDSCPACKTEWAFDSSGKIYSCTATVGKQEETLGTFYPAVSLDEEAVAAWEERDVTTISACAGCPSQLVCGGGCGSVAKNREGTVSAPDCRPAVDLIGMGIALYGTMDQNL